VVTGTDRNAIGMMRGLVAAGYRLPGDQAVVGFDDITATRYVVPSLASVRQPLGAPAEAMLQPVVEALFRLGAQPQTIGEIAQAVRTYAPAVTAPAVTAPAVTADAVAAAPVDVPAAGRGDVPAGGAAAVRRVERGVQQLVLQLAHAQARMQFDDITYLQGMLNTQYELGMDLLRSHEQDPRRLGWLGRTSVRGGSLGLWQESPQPPAPIRCCGSSATSGPAGRWRSPRPGRPHEPTAPVRVFPSRPVPDVAEASGASCSWFRSQRRQGLGDAGRRWADPGANPAGARADEPGGRAAGRRARPEGDAAVPA
jgi:hypothetical protein